jgi:hypothetical protein
MDREAAIYQDATYERDAPGARPVYTDDGTPCKTGQPGKDH